MCKHFQPYEENNAELYFAFSISWCELVPVVMLVKEWESPDFSLKRILCLGTVCAYSTQYDIFQMREGCSEAEAYWIFNHSLLKLQAGELLK